MRAVFTISVTNATWSGVWNTWTLLLYALGVIGGPALNPRRQRS